MMHTVNELVRVVDKRRALCTKAYAQTHNLDTKPVAYIVADKTTVLTETGKQTIYLYGEKTWFDTMGERDAYRLAKQVQAEENIKKAKLISELTSHLADLPEEEFAAFVKGVLN